MSSSLPTLIAHRLETLKIRWHTAQRSPSAEFLAWRQQFLFRRVQLLAWVILGALMLAVIVTWLLVIPSLSATGNSGLTLNINRLWDDFHDVALQFLGVLLFLGVLRTVHLRQSPEKMFLLLSWLVLLPPHFRALTCGEAQFDTGTWLLSLRCRPF